eukprot:1686213-Prymnesium_polylepis.1
MASGGGSYSLKCCKNVFRQVKTDITCNEQAFIDAIAFNQPLNALHSDFPNWRPYGLASRCIGRDGRRLQPRFDLAHLKLPT